MVEKFQTIQILDMVTQNRDRDFAQIPGLEY